MRKVFYIFIILLVVLAVLALNLISRNGSLLSKFGKKDIPVTPTPSETNVDLSLCKTEDRSKPETTYETSGKMRDYLIKNEGFTLETKFIGKIIDGTNCFSFKMENYELYVDAENNLYVLKDGQEYKREAPRNWVY